MVKVSVIMPVYNTNSQLLRRSIDSVLAQSLRDIELILIDDGSTNGSENICDEYASLDQRVRVLHLPNGGLCKARNHGMHMAMGEYLAFCDHDDIYGENQLKDNYRLAKRFHNVDVIKFGYHFICLDTRLRFPVQNFEPNCVCYFQQEKLLEQWPYLKSCGILTYVWDSLFRRDFLKENHLEFDEYFKIGHEDMDFCARVFLYIQTFAYNPQKYYYYYRYTSSTSRGMDFEKAKRLMQDEVHVFYTEMHVVEKRYPPQAEHIRQAIVFRNMMSMISSAMRPDAAITLCDRISFVQSIRGHFEGKRSVNYHHAPGMKNKICTFLFQHHCEALIVLSSMAYIKWLNIRTRLSMLRIG